MHDKILHFGYCVDNVLILLMAHIGKFKWTILSMHNV